MKKQGKAKVNHHPPIEEEDMLKIYDYVSSSDSPKVLQQKVFVDIMVHFGRRGRENLRDLKRSDFAISTVGVGDRYVYLKDERTKNHQDDDEGAEGRMYEVKGNIRCPVKRFVKYIRRLNPLCFNFFQQPRDEAIEGIYFNNSPLGHNKLGCMLKSISEAAGLSREYTNHSLRATTVHVLDAARFPSRHIMTLAGHKSETSLKKYTGQTDVNTKTLMSRKISEKTNSINACSTKTVTNTGVQIEFEALANSQELEVIQDVVDVRLDDGFDDLFQNVQMPVL